MTVLVVDDDKDTAQSTADLLDLWGYAVRVAADGPAALCDADRQMPDVILLDLGLPCMSGWEVARRMRAAARGKQPVLVAVSGYGAADDLARSAEAGIDLHLVKPADPAELCRFLAGVRDQLAPVLACAWCAREFAGRGWRDGVAGDAAVTHGICPLCHAKNRRERREEVGGRHPVAAPGSSRLDGFTSRTHRPPERLVAGS